MTPVKRGLRRTIIAAVAAGIALLAWNPALTGIARFMTVETAIEPADAILPLYQDSVHIPAAAAAWLQRGYAPKVLVFRRNPSRVERLGLRPAPHVLMRRQLEVRGVAADKILEIGHDIRNTGEVVEAVADALGARPNQRLIVIASAPMSRLTWMDLSDGMARRGIDLRIDAVPPTAFDERNWWKTRDGVITYFDVYCLWLLRFVR